MNKLCTVVTLVGMSSAAFAAEVAWTVKPNTPSDSDINTEGRCVYAYTPSATETKVNGVLFGRFTYLPNHQWDAVSNFADDAVFDTGFTRNCGAGWMGETQRAAWDAAGGSAEYKNLLNVSWYRSIGGVPNSTLTLRGLTVGKRYLVQIWICDARSTTSGPKKKLTVGGVTGNCYGENGYGCHFIGRFTADAMTQDVAITYAYEAQFNAFQLRCLDEANVEWTSAWTSGESDVRTDGAQVYAYKPNDTTVIAGTGFKGNQDSNITYYGDRSDPDIRFDNPTNSAVRKMVVSVHDDFCWRDASVPDGAYSYSEAYVRLIRGGYTAVYSTSSYDESWGHNYNRRTVVLRHLMPGKRYLVQFWTIDNRNEIRKYPTTVVGFGTVLTNNNGVTYGHGSFATGTFTAVDTEQPISFYHRSSTEDMKAGECYTRESYGPIQVRCLDEEEEDVWYVGDTETDGSVVTRGQPLWAFAGVRTTVANTRFTQFYEDNTGDFRELKIMTNGVAQTMTRNTGRAFISEAIVEVSPAVSNLLGNAVYNDYNSPVNHVLELHQLTPGRRYLVQLWAMDTRKTRQGVFADQTLQFRIITGDKIGTKTYKEDRAPLGQYLVGIFRATNECQTIVCGASAFQLNAIQVRVLDALPIDSQISWTGAATEAGEASISTEGTLHCAYAPWSFTTEGGVTFAEADTGLTDLGGDGNVVMERAFKQSYDGYAPDETFALFKNAWFNLNGTGGDNTMTLGNLKPTYEYLVQLFVADLRNNACGGRTMTAEEQTVRFGPYDDSLWLHGGVLTGRFTASETTKSFLLRYKGAGDAQLNAIQVREIGPTRPERDLTSAAAWTTDGAGWKVGGVDQAGVTLWDTEVGATNVAFVGGAATLALGSDVTVGALYGVGNVTIGSEGTDKAISVENEIIAPTATVNAVWSEPIVRKYESGTTVIAGECPVLKNVKVYGGELVLDGAVSRPLEITVAAPGTLGFTTNRVLAIASLAGDGALAGPGGIVLDGGAAFVVPAGLTYADGFAWMLTDGSTLALPTDYDASKLCISIPDPAAYADTLVVTHDGTATGKPTFVIDRSYRVAKEEAGWRLVKKAGTAIIIR